MVSQMKVVYGTERKARMMTNDEFKGAVAADLTDIFARNPDVSQRVISDAAGLGPTSLNKYLNWTDRTPNMPLGTYLHIMQELGRRDALRANHPVAALLAALINKPAFFEKEGRQQIPLFDYLNTAEDIWNDKIATNLLRYYERRVP